MVAATATVFATAPAYATLANRGAVDVTTGFPAFYTDAGGLALQPCLDGLPLCPISAADFLSAGAGGEGFYSLVSSTAGAFDLRLAHEGAFFDVGANQEMVFQRTQVSHQAVSLPHNTGYVITDPYGTFNCTTNNVGSITKNGCRTQTGGTAPQDFDSALGGRIGPFLTWDTFGSPLGAPPAGYIGDGATPHAVMGSPTGFNTFRVQGPGANDAATDQCPTVDGPISACVESSLWVVSGKVIAGPSATVTVSSLTFPNTAVGQASAAQTSTYISNGTVAANVASVTLGGARPQDFTVTDTCVGAVASGHNCSVVATYQPQPGSPGTTSATVTIVDDTPGSPRIINLAGSSVGVLSVPQTALDFGTTRVGVVTPNNVAVTNTGVSSLSVASPVISGPYTAEASACGSSLAAGASCNVVVSARPTRVGPQAGSLTIASGSAQKVVTLSGTGATGSSSAAPISVSFPATQVEDTTAGSPITVSNSGPVAMTVGTSSISGTDAGQFVLNQGTCANSVVTPGSSCVLVVQFAPRKAGVLVASLLVPGDGGNLSVPLSGTGSLPAPGPSPPPSPSPTPPAPEHTMPAPGPVGDAIRPFVIHSSPAVGATRARRNAVVALRFNEAVTGASRHAVALYSALTGKKVAASVAYDRRTHIVTIDPLTKMVAHGKYRVVLTRGVRDLSGNSLRASSYPFTTRG